MTDLLVAHCSVDAAKFAVLNWHYSQTWPAGKSVQFGVWENSGFVGAVVYGRGANHRLGSPFETRQTETAELTRVALTTHDRPTSEIVAKSLKKLKAGSPGLRVVVSYADTNVGHVGTLYQAGNWVYTGLSGDTDQGVIIHGQTVHKRSVSSRYGTRSLDWLREHVDPNARLAPALKKHRYVYPLDRGMRRCLDAMAEPYP